MFISKSRYVSGCQCPKILWMDKHMPEEFDESVMDQAILSAGNDVGDLAMGYFGPYVEVPYLPGEYADMANITCRLLDERTPIICEASFLHDGCFCMVDILRVEGDAVSIVEVKSSTHVKDYHLLDLSFQVWLLSQCGMNVKSASIMHLNADYVRKGELDLRELFVVEDFTETAKGMAGEVSGRIREFRSICANPEEPDIPIGPQCESPFACGYIDWCWRDVPRPNVHDVARLRKSKAWELHQNGLVSFEDLMGAIAAGELSLNPKQVMQVMMELKDPEDLVNGDEVREFLSSISYPIYYLDFETLMPAVPPYDGMHPYQQLPTQYSLHWEDAPNGSLHHAEFLAEPGADPRRAIAERLCEDIPDDACVLAYNMSFEKGRIRDLAQMFPDLHDHLMAIHDNMADLMVPFANGAFYNKAMCGSHSIKYVLPALFPDDPELDYHSLEDVRNGSDAMEAYAAMEVATAEEATRIRQNLLKYCELDTYAMVKILSRLREAVQPAPSSKDRP